MGGSNKETNVPVSAAEVEVRWLYQEFLNSWNKRSADGMAELLLEHGNIIENHKVAGDSPS